MFGIVMATLSYYVICTYISPITEALIDEAVLPPQKGEEGVVIEEIIGETKGEVRTETKEVSTNVV